MVKVSICIPTYNNVSALTRLLDSIVIQEYRDFEIIITDDSEDESVTNLIASYSFLGIKYYRNETRLGATSNCNKAITLAEGEFIKMMHHDDWFNQTDSLFQFVKMLEENSLSYIAFSGSRQVSSDKIYNRHISDKQVLLLQQNPNNIFLKNCIGAPSAVIFRNDLLYFDENLKWLVDIDLYLNILSKHPVFTYTNTPLVSIEMSKSQLTEKCRDDIKLNIEEYCYLYNKWFKEKPSKQIKRKMIKIFFMKSKKYIPGMKICGITYYDYICALLSEYIK